MSRLATTSSHSRPGPLLPCRWNPVQTSTAQYSPAWLLEPSLVPGDLESLPRLRDAAAAFPLAGVICSKAEHASQRCTHTDTPTQRTLTGPVTQTATDDVLLSTAPTCRTHIKYKQPATSPASLGLAETGGHQRRHTHDTLSIHKHTHVHGSPEYWHSPSVPPVPLPGSWPSDPPHGSPTC